MVNVSYYKPIILAFVKSTVTFLKLTTPPNDVSPLSAFKYKPFTPITCNSFDDAYINPCEELDEL
ncbi:hypothetical protein D3C76_1366360 [compost metagenome]